MHNSLRDTENHTEKKNSVTLKIERTKDMSNAEHFQWGHKGLTFLDNNSRQNFQCDFQCNILLVIQLMFATKVHSMILWFRV